MLTVHAYIEVTTIEAGLAFYSSGLGLTLKRRYSRTWAELEGARIPIFLLGEGPNIADLGVVRAPRNFSRHWTPVHLDFVVEAFDETLQRLLAAGATLDREVKTREYGRIANMADPFGNGFDLIAFTGDGYEAVNRMSGTA